MTRLRSRRIFFRSYYLSVRQQEPFNHGLLSKKDIIRCLKRFVAREIYHALLGDHHARAAIVAA